MALLCLCSAAAQASEYDKWAKHNPDEKTAVDHSPMSSILKFLSVKEPNGKVQIAYFLAKDEVQVYIQDYIQYLEKIPVSLLNKDEQLAYWLNLHNTVVIDMLSQGRNLRKRIKKLRGQPGEPGEEWAKKRVTVENTPLSLEEIEQHILIKHWQDPLVVYGLSYGTKGSALIGEGFSGNTVKAQLAAIATAFISDKNNVKVRKDKVKLSSLYAWNRASLFADDDQKIISHLQQYAQGKSAEKLQKVTKVDESHKFNWSTNAYAKPRQNRNISSGGERGYGSGS